MANETSETMSDNISSDSPSDLVTIIQPNAGWQSFDFKELLQYRDLFFFLVWRDIKVVYAQTILGFAWAVLLPLIQIVLFTIIFGKVANVFTDDIPYILFSSVAIIPWTYMSQSMTQASQSLVQGSAMLGKIYFPRLIYPLAPILSKLVDFAISMIIILCLMVYFRIAPTWNLLLFPLFLLLMMAIPFGIGLWLSSLAIRFRDVRHVMPFFMQMLMFSAPIVYSASSVPDAYRLLYSLNPIVSVIEGYRACLLGFPIPWLYVWPGIVTTVLLVVSGALYFKRMERIIVDVI